MTIKHRIVIIIYGIVAIIIYNLSKSYGYETRDLTNLGYSTGTANYIIQECNKIEGVKLKKGIGNAEHCIRLASSVGGAESSRGKETSYNIFGLRIWIKDKKGNKRLYKFKSQKDGFDKWFIRYKKFWYNRKKGAIDFYSLNGRPSTSRYCTDEESSGLLKFHCPNGYKAFDKTWNKLLNIKQTKNEKTIKQGTITTTKGKSTFKKINGVSMNNPVNSYPNSSDIKQISNGDKTKPKSKPITTTKSSINSKSKDAIRIRGIKSKN